MNESQENQGPKWWGSTLSKLKSALSFTKSAVVDSVLAKDSTPAVTTPEKQAQDATPPGAQEVSFDPAAEDAAVRQAQERFAESAPLLVEPAAALAAAPSPATRIVERAVPVSEPPPQPIAPPEPIDEEYLENLEEKLIRADLGVVTAQAMVHDLRKQARNKGWTTADVRSFLKQEFQSILAAAKHPQLMYQPGKLNIYLVVGVNGTGKTTSIGKLCWRFKAQRKKVLIAAADTFRAAAETQLEIWAERAAVDIVRLADGADPGAVVFQSIKQALLQSYDCLVIDTAGRLHNKTNLMAELKKVRGVIEKNAANMPLESLLVLDASTGQNGLRQAKVFTEVCPLTGVILTKLDGTAKGGVVFSIARELKIPVKLIGLGEQIDDLRDFEPELFVEALF